jgi:hypothetical protein
MSTSDVINFYPKSSCPTENCGNSFPEEKGFNSSLGLPGCKKSDFFDCYNTLEFRKQIQPSHTQGYITLNPSAYTSKISPNFDMVDVKNKCCPPPSYINQDPRLFDAPRAVYLPLDRPPANGDVRLKDIYNSDLDNYGSLSGYENYENIKDGDITYYVDKSIQDVLYEPIYVDNAEVIQSIYQDPMGGIKMDYVRKPLVNTKNPVITDCQTYNTKLSFLEDTQSHREDLISYQQRQHNQSKYTTRWHF